MEDQDNSYCSAGNRLFGAFLKLQPIIVGNHMDKKVSRTKSKSQIFFDKWLSANELNEAEMSLMLSHQNHLFLD